MRHSWERLWLAGWQAPNGDAGQKTQPTFPTLLRPGILTSAKLPLRMGINVKRGSGAEFDDGDEYAEEAAGSKGIERRAKERRPAKLGKLCRLCNACR